MFGYFRWLVQITAQICAQTPLFSNLSKYGGFSDVQLLEIASDASNKILADNFIALESHLKKMMPAFAGTFGLNEFKHINPLKRNTMSRQSNARALGMISGSNNVNLYDAYVVFGNAKSQGYLSFEEAMDLALLMPYNALNLKERRALNPFLFYHE